jgi:hypothetical protein
MKAILRVSFAAAMLLGATLAMALSAASKPGIDISGRWNINDTLSDDAEAILARREQEQMEEMRRMQERRRARTPLEQLDEEMTAPSPLDPHRSRDRRTAREAELRRMLGVTKVLEISQPATGETVAIHSDDDSRKFESGARSQVSMPEGQLADLTAGWDGEWFVIERRVKSGPRVVEKYRRLKKTDQLESTIAWAGDTLLTGIKVHRIFDRAVGTAPPPDPTRGPVR